MASSNKEASEAKRKAPCESEESREDMDEKRLKVSAENFKCSICLGLWHDPVSLVPCQHNFCNGCFSEWFKSSKGRGNACKCPQCRVDVMFAGRNHAMRSVVEDMVGSDPGLKRPAEETEKLDRSALINSNCVKLSDIGNAAPAPPPPPSAPIRVGFPAATGHRHVGLVYHPRRPSYIPAAPIYYGRHNDEDDEDDDGEEVDEEDEEEEEEENEEDRAFIDNSSDLDDDGEPADDEEEYVVSAGEDDEICQQCIEGNRSSFTCPPGATHLTCTACFRKMPERNDVGVPQKCAGCKLNYCDLYWRSQNFDGCCEKLQPVCERQPDRLPPTTHRSNPVEQEFTRMYLEEKHFTIQDVVKEWMAKVDNAEIALPDMQITSTSPVCDKCANSATAELMNRFRMSIPRTELPRDAAQRPDCWYGYACRTQVKLPHALKLNHMCEPTSDRVQR